jgi:hypothetical protein
MKRVLWIISFFALFSSAFGQKSIDALFKRYAGKEGFVTVTFNGNLLKLVRCLDDDMDRNCLPGDITELRILVQEDEHMEAVNFYELVMKDIDLTDYDEFMRVKKAGQDLRMLVRSQGDRFKEFLLVSGGEDNFIIQIKGNMTFQEAEKFSSDAKKKKGVGFIANHD